jgi:hypothetical protein
MMRLEFNDAEQAMLDEAKKLEAAGKAKQQEAFDARDARERVRPLKDRLVFAARTYCHCGHGMAYDPLNEVGRDESSPFKMADRWTCSAQLLDIADEKLTHTSPLPFAFYELKSEDQPSANGLTTREPVAPNPAVNPPKSEGGAK